MKYLIISGGQIDSDFALEIIEKGSFDCIIAADSGMNFLYKNKIKADVILGDFDSVDTAALDYFKGMSDVEICVLNPIKDDTDTEHAIHFAIERGAEHITILGATGTRIDHVMGNINLLGIGLEKNVAIELLDKHNRIRMFNHSFEIKRTEQFGDFVSLIPFMGNITGLSLRGMKYNLDNYELKGFNSLGISNEIEDERAQISFGGGTILVIESRDN